MPAPEEAVDREDHPAPGRVAGLRSAQRRPQRWVRIGFAVGAVVLALGIVGLAIRPGEVPAQVALPAANTYGATSLPPWPAPADPAPGTRAAGLPVSDMSAMDQHFHAHLDVIVDGRPVPVPADLGVDRASGQMSALHTHDATGLVHVESADPAGRYTLGQLFNEWDVALDATRLGGLPAGGDRTLTAFVDGVAVPGNPAAIELRDHRQIALV